MVNLTVIKLHHFTYLFWTGLVLSICYVSRVVVWMFPRSNLGVSLFPLLLDWPGSLCLLFKVAYVHAGSWINRLCQESLHVMMIYVAKRELFRERVISWYFARIKCGDILPGWLWMVLSVLRIRLIVWFSEVVDRQYSGMRGAHV